MEFLLNIFFMIILINKSKETVEIKPNEVVDFYNGNDKSDCIGSNNYAKDIQIIIYPNSSVCKNSDNCVTGTQKNILTASLENFNYKYDFKCDINKTYILNCSSSQKTKLKPGDYYVTTLNSNNNQIIIKSMTSSNYVTVVNTPYTKFPCDQWKSNIGVASQGVFVQKIVYDYPIKSLPIITFGNMTVDCEKENSTTLNCYIYQEQTENEVLIHGKVINACNQIECELNLTTILVETCCRKKIKMVFFYILPGVIFFLVAGSLIISAIRAMREEKRINKVSGMVNKLEFDIKEMETIDKEKNTENSGDTQ